MQEISLAVIASEAWQSKHFLPPPRFFGRGVYTEWDEILRYAQNDRGED